jgi:hypothetical protein
MGFLRRFAFQGGSPTNIEITENIRICGALELGKLTISEF